MKLKKLLSLSLSGALALSVMAAPAGAFAGNVNGLEALRLAFDNGTEDIDMEGAEVVIPADDVIYPWGEEDYPDLKAHLLWSESGELSDVTLTMDAPIKYGFLVDSSEDHLISDLTVNSNGIQSPLYINGYDGITILADVNVYAEGGSGIYAEYATGDVYLYDCNVYQNGIASGNRPWFETAIAAAQGSNITIDGGRYESSKYAVYCYGSAPSVVTINDGEFIGELLAQGDDEIIICGGTFTDDPSEYLAYGYTAVEENGIWSVEVDEAAVADCEAMVGNAFYDTLEEAVEAAELFETVTLLKDVVLQGKSLTVDDDDSLILDLNGYELSAAFAEGKASATIVNKGLLRIEDYSAEGTGVITTVASAPDTEWAAGFPAYANNTITNSGALVIGSGTVENGTSGGACYAIDNNSTNGDALLHVEGGTVIHNANNFAIRQFANSTVHENSVTIEGGEVTGRRAVWIQLPGSSGAEKKAELTVTGGVLNSTDEEYNMAVYSYTFGDSFAETYITVEGGVFNGDIALTGGTPKTPVENVEITGGTFNGNNGVYSYGEMAGFIEGGKFKAEPDAAYIAEGMTAVNKGEYWVVGEPEEEDDGSDETGSEDNGSAEPEYSAPSASTGSSDGWNDITDEIETSDKVVVEMNGNSSVPGKVLDAAAEADTDVVFETEKGTWEISGSDIPEDTSALSLRVSFSGKLPDAAEEAAAEADDALLVKVSKAFETNGVKASLTVATEKENAGKSAAIYALNSEGEPELITSVPVGKDGSVKLPVEAASQYLVVISDQGALKAGWQKNDRGEWLYGNENGVAVTGWYKDASGNWYHSDAHGVMETGWLTDTDGKEYYLNASGAMRRGWLLENGEWYYFGSSGAMVKGGWTLYNGAWYYLGADGAMLTDTVTPDGYRVDANGVWVR